VLEIHVPDLAGGATLEEALSEVRPSFVAFFISFVVVAIAWSGHRDLFALVRQTDRTLVWLNMLYLLPLSILPFGASLFARYDTDPIALSWYGSILVCIAMARLAIWVYTTGRPHLLVGVVDKRSRRVGAAIVAVPGLIYAVAVVLASYSATATVVLYFVVPIGYFVSIAVIRATAPVDSAERDFT
jgi:uncharacterized membrane protein